MNFIKKQSVGFYFTALTAVIAIIGLAFYIVNCNTNYFKNLGVNSTIVVCMVAAILSAGVAIVTSQTNLSKVISDIAVICIPMFLIIALAMFISSRVNGIAGILSFERNAQTLADLSSAIKGMAFCGGSVLLGIISAFFDIVKE